MASVVYYVWILLKFENDFFISEVDHVLPSDDQFSFLHVKVFGLHNHLYGDTWAKGDVYYIDKRWRVHKSVKNRNVSI
jgi:hypothetical protein